MKNGIATACVLLVAVSAPCRAQGYSMPNHQMNQNDMQQMLDVVSSPGGNWQTAPQPRMQQQVMQQQMMQQQAVQQRGAFPKPTRSDVMRVFFEGGSLMHPGSGAAPMGNYSAFGGGSAAPPSGNSNAAGIAYSNYQRAASEETTSRNYANKARYDKDQWVRKDSASRAQYAANNANYAAQRAESAAYSGDPQARGYASQARACANRARSNADRARYNADTIR